MRAVVLLVTLAACACGAAQVASYEAAQDACIANAAALDASPSEKRASADACRCAVKQSWHRPCDGGAP